jgi:hypothetical protein
LLEPQRTNACPFSEQLDDAAWIKEEATITPNNISAPDGTISADLILDNAVSGEHLVYQGISTSAGIHTWSVFAKAQNLNFLIISAFSGSHNRTWFNLSNGTIGTNAAGSTATITNYGNGWYRCSVSRNYTSGTFFFVAQTAPSDGVFSYTGSGNGLYLWGAQVEAGSYVSSYIPTLGASVTRLADVASKTGISSLIGQTEGVLYFDIDFKNVPIFDSYFYIQDAGGNNYVGLRLVAGTIRLEAVVADTLQASINFAVNETGRKKIAMAYQENNYALYVNGNLVGTDTSALVGAMSVIDLATALPSSNSIGINSAALYTTRLSNAELATLTAL